MLNERMYGLGNEPSAIRELFSYGLKRKAEIGAENVFDYSLGNPSVPAPPEVKQVVKDLLDCPPVELHSYSPSAGIPSVREKVASYISENFDIPASMGNIYMTCGAAASVAITLSAVTRPGDEVVVNAPYFPEYKVWIETASCTCVEVLAQIPSFQMSIEALDDAITEKTSAILINSPNNPVGNVYPRENIEALARLLERKEAEFGHPIYLICDEPYRAITYGAEIPFIPKIYPRTIVCYSYSKALSLPGERIGWIYVSGLMEEADEVFAAVCGAGRALGYVCAPVLFQKVVERCLDLPSDVRAYEHNRELLTEGLDALGYEYVQPEGAFYLWMKALEPDAEAFCEKAKTHELLIVPSDSFGMKGWVRLSYCISEDVIKRSMPAFKALAEDYA